MLAEGEPIGLALRRLKRHVNCNRMVLPPSKRHFIKNTEVRQAKEFRKLVADRQRIVEVFPTTHREGVVARERQRIVKTGGGADSASLCALPSLTSCHG